MSIKPSVLVVEDEASIRRGLSDVLTYHGYGVAAYADAESALAAASDPVDIAVLDVMLPGMDGLELCGRLRERAPSLPILLLTAKGSEDDVVAGFRAGADDYMTKPFSVRELLMRIEALARRALGPAAASDFGFGPWTIEPASLRAHSNGEARELTPRELALLTLFVREKGRVVSRRLLLKEVWGMAHASEVETRTVDMHIAKLRKKLDPEFRLVETVRGAGYRFTD